MTNQLATETITLAGGCFWCLEAVYERVDGVVAVESGYSNGHVERPTYEQVCGGRTGHAEAVRVVFDPARIALQDLLEIFFAIHDPTTRDRQGHDLGPQYRSAIFWHDELQRGVIDAVMAEVDAATGGRVVTQVEPVRNYWRAEDFHQRYFDRNPYQGYCAAVVAPKVEKFRRTFRQRVRAD
jgi:peptide-methionine (S)-S-oxide reductase